MSRFRLRPNPEQEDLLLAHCAQARYVWNLAVEQNSWWTPARARRSAPGYLAQCRQLTEARAAEPWLAEGLVNVQQQALRDFAQSMARLFSGVHGRPSWRKKHLNEGFRITAPSFYFGRHIQRLNRRWGRLKIPKVGWVRFHWSRPVPPCKSYRVTRDRSGRWHVAFAVIPETIPAPVNGRVVGVDRGVTVTAALSTGQNLTCPSLPGKERARLRKAERRVVRAPRGSDQQHAEQSKVAYLRVRETDIRKNWVEKTSTHLASSFDVIRFEDLRIRNMTTSARGTVERPGSGVARKTGLNRAILAQGWGLLARRTEDKAPGRTEKVVARNTSLRCSDCGWIDKNSRKSQAGFVCTVCGFTCNADLNASINIAAGQDRKVPRQRSRAGGTTRRKALSVREPLVTEVLVARNPSPLWW